ncbi:MAG: hypothetical protein ACXU9U_03190 [Parachlamydiaceae bacterium]
MSSAASPSGSIYEIPAEVNNLILAFSGNSTILFSQIAKVFKETANENKTALFVERFGALATHEKSQPIDPIASLHHSTLKLLASEASHIHLAFDKLGYPYLESLPKEEEGSWWNTMCKRYRVFRGDFDPHTNQKLAAIFAEHAKIFREFEGNTPHEIDATQNCEGFSDLADKTTRLHTIQKEQEIYQSIIENYRSSIEFHPFEKIIYSIVSLVHSIFVTSNHRLVTPNLFSRLSLWLNPLKKFDTPLKLFRQARTVLLNKRTIQINSDNIDVELKAKFSNWGSFYISIERTDKSDSDNSKFLGYINLRLKKNSNEMYEQDMFKNSRCIYAEPGIYVNDANKSVLKLLTQVAVETFLRQSVKILSLVSVYDLAAYFAVTGFSSRAGLSFIREKVLAARGEGMLYPPYHDYSSLDVHLKKSNKTLNTGLFTPYSTEYCTRFRKTELKFRDENDQLFYYSGKSKLQYPVEKTKGPALIDDAIETEDGIECSQKTWEQYIQDNSPILSAGTRAILPRIYD